MQGWKFIQQHVMSLLPTEITLKETNKILQK